MPLNDYMTFCKARVGDRFTRPVFIRDLTETKKDGGNTHVRFTLLDGESEVSAMLFSTTAEQLKNKGVAPHIVAFAVIKVTDYNGKSFNIDSIEPYRGDDLTINDFIITPPIDIGAMYDEMISSLKAVGDDMNGTVTPVSEIAVAILEKYKKEYTHSSAAVKVHHNFKGGLIYHSYRMFKAAEALSSVYTELDKELLMTAAAIHDIGKMWEYHTDQYGDSEYSTSGVLFGHMYMGAKLVSNIADEYEKAHEDEPHINGQKLKLLVHMILSHHGKHEWGAVVAPAIPEAFVLHYIDNIDVKLNVCAKEYKNMAPGTVTQTRPFTLDGNLYKPKYDE